MPRRADARMQGLFPAFARFPVYLWVPARFFADFCIAWQIKKLEWSVTFFCDAFKQGGALAKNRGVFSLRARVFLFRGMQGNSAPPLGAPSLTNGAPGSASRRGAPEAGALKWPWSVFGALFERDHGPFRRALPGGTTRDQWSRFPAFYDGPPRAKSLKTP